MRISFSFNNMTSKPKWDAFVNENFINKPKGKNAKWFTRSELEDTIERYNAKKKYIDELEKRKKELGVAILKTIPEDLIHLKEEATTAGPIDVTRYRVEYTKENKATLYQRGRDSEYSSIAPIEDSYQLLMEIHLELDHCSGKKMHEYVKMNRLYSYPSNLIKKFPFYCSQCRSYMNH